LNFFGASVALDIDFRDNAILPKHGVRLFAQQSYSQITNLTETHFNNSRISLELYQSTRTVIPITFGIKGALSHAGGDVPFYMLPYVEQRGIAAQRYQGRNTAVVEGELQWHASSRWTLLGFYGAGRAWGVREYADVDTHGAGGGGFRYMLARLLKMAGGIDFAWGPEFALYLQVGTAWR